MLHDRDIETVNCRVQAIGAVVKADIRPHGAGAAPEVLEKRDVWFEGGWHETPVYARHTVGAGARVEGPAIVEEMSSTAIVLPGQSGRCDTMGNLIVEPAD